jgi:hypothetical protein
MIESVEVIGKRYAVVSMEGEGDYGECFSDQCRIEVRATGQCHQQQADTLLHEVMHAVDHEMHCSMSEPQIRRMATGLLAVLRQNPQLIAFLVT